MATGLIRARPQVKTCPDTMDSRPDLSLAEQLAAAQEWWRDAGVDLAFVDAPQAWLSAPAEEPPSAAPVLPVAKPPPPPEPMIGGDPASWPQDLGSFAQWWLEEPTLDRGGTFPRVPPRGPQGARLAIIVPMPEEADTATLLSGPQGRMLAAMADALGIASEEVYFAAALPRHMPLPDWDSMGRSGLGKVLRHHLALAAPKRLLVLGRDILPLLQNDPAQSAPAANEIAIQADAFPVLASYQPARLLQRAQWRAGLWRRLLDWMDGDTR